MVWHTIFNPRIPRRLPLPLLTEPSFPSRHKCYRLPGRLPMPSSHSKFKLQSRQDLCYERYQILKLFSSDDFTKICIPPLMCRQPQWKSFSLYSNAFPSTNSDSDIFQGCPISGLSAETCLSRGNWGSLPLPPSVWQYLLQSEVWSWLEEQPFGQTNSVFAKPLYALIEELISFICSSGAQLPWNHLVFDGLLTPGSQNKINYPIHIYWTPHYFWTLHTMFHICSILN